MSPRMATTTISATPMITLTVTLHRLPVVELPFDEPSVRPAGVRLVE